MQERLISFLLWLVMFLVYAAAFGQSKPVDCLEQPNGTYQCASPQNPVLLVIKRPHWYKDKWWWAGEVAIAAAVFADYHSTARFRNMGRAEGNNVLLGSYPSQRRVALVGLAAFTSYSALHWGAWRVSHNDPSRAWRSLGRWGTPAIVAGVHVPAAVRNYRYAHPCPSGSFCNF